MNTDRVVSRYIGETEKNLAAVFELAEQTGAVLLFDEADALFGRRTAVKDSHDRDANVDVAHLLSLLSGFPGAVVIATASTADARLAAAVTAMVRRPRRR